MTALMTVKRRTDPSLASHYDFLDYMADCVIQLDQRVLEQVTTRRLRVIKYRGITTLLTNLISAMDPGREITGIDLSSVIDTVIVLRNVEKKGCFVRDLGLLKSRGRAHSSRIHEFRITDNGFEIGGKEGDHLK